LKNKRSSAHHYYSNSPDILSPTIERSTHGAVERLEETIKDTEGRVCRPYRAIDILAAMERRGAITGEMRSAGETFRTKFTHAHLDQLRAADITRSSAGKSSADPHQKNYDARDHVWRAICAVGGLASAGGACLWHVVGLEHSLKEWAVEQGWSGRLVSQEVASGILIAALGALEAHYQAR
jgi:hypothetical protein